MRRRRPHSRARAIQQSHARRRDDRPVLRVAEPQRLVGRRRRAPAELASSVRQRRLSGDGDQRRDGAQRRRHSLALQLRRREFEHEH